MEFDNLISEYQRAVWEMASQEKLNSALGQIQDKLKNGTESDYQLALKMACQYGMVAMLDWLLKEGHAVPSFNNSEALYIAAQMGFTQGVELLLKDERVDPNVGIEPAAMGEFSEIVTLLLKDKRLNPLIKDHNILWNLWNPRSGTLPLPGQAKKDREGVARLLIPRLQFLGLPLSFFIKEDESLFSIATKKTPNGAMFLSFIQNNSPEVVENTLNKLLPKDWDELYKELVKAVKNNDNEVAFGLMALDKIRQMSLRDVELDVLAVKSSNAQFSSYLSLTRYEADILEGSDTVDIDQHHLNARLMRYLQLKKQNTARIIDKKGQCNGWVFLYQIFRSLESHPEFFELLNEISKWDGKSNSLSVKPGGNLGEKYRDVNDVLANVIHHLIIFQANSEAFQGLSLYWLQEDRKMQYDLVKDRKLGREVQSLYKSRGAYDPQKLIQMLELMSSISGVSIDLSIGKSLTTGHIAGIYITPEGNFDYYDSNIGRRLKTFSSAQELVEHIENNFVLQLKCMFLLQNQNMAVKDVKLYYTFSSYKFYKKEEKIPQVTQASLLPLKCQPLPNGFTPLHLAIFENNPDKIQEAIANNPELLARKNDFEESPLLFACKLNNEVAANILLEAAKQHKCNIDIESKDINLLDFPEDKAYHKVLCKLMHENLIDIHGYDKNGLALASFILADNEKSGLQKLASLNWDKKDIYGNSLLLSLVAYGNFEEDDTFKRLLLQKKCNINDQTPAGITPLMVAAKEGKIHTVRQLLEAGAVTSLTDSTGKSAQYYAAGNSKIMALLKMHEMKKKPLTPLQSLKAAEDSVENDALSPSIPEERDKKTKPTN